MFRLRKVIIIAASLLIIYLIVIYFFGSDESKIRSIIEDLQAAIMAEDSGATFADVSLLYQDESGIKYLPARYIMKKFYTTTDQINLRLPNISISITGGKATVDVDIILTGNTGRETHYILGTLDQPVRISIGMEKGIAGWKIISTSNIKPSDQYLDASRKYSIGY